MRQYRGLTKSDKWVYGYYLKCRGHHYIAPIYNDETGFDDRYLQEGTDEDGCFEVIPETVGQSTDLNDKNGKEIYEGDIVKEDYYIAWYYNRWVYAGLGDIENIQVEGNLDNECEVIGNIHQNPELLEK